MTREEKTQIIAEIAGLLKQYPHFYITDISGLDADKTAQLRRKCFDNDVKLMVVKNTLFSKALEQVGGEYVEEISKVLEGSTSVMFANVNKAPAKLIDEFRKKGDRPVLKAAWVEESVYVGDNMLPTLVAIKSKDELVGDIIMLLQSPAKNVISALQGGAGNKIAGLVKALEERAK